MMIRAGPLPLVTASRLSVEIIGRNHWVSEKEPKVPSPIVSVEIYYD